MLRSRGLQFQGLKNWRRSRLGAGDFSSRVKNRRRSLLEPGTPAPGSQKPKSEPPGARDSSSRVTRTRDGTSCSRGLQLQGRVSRTGDGASWSRGLQLQGLKNRRRSLLEPGTLVTGSPQTEPPLKWPALQHIDCYAGTSLPLEC